jgi:Leucine-rich repeat (LRR) protein
VFPGVGLTTLARVHDLDLSLNQITLIPDQVLASVPTLQSLSVAVSCMVSRLLRPFVSDPVSLPCCCCRQLNLNRLSVVTDTIFQGLPDLLNLYLDDNQITLIEPDSFNDLSALRTL